MRFLSFFFLILTLRPTMDLSKILITVFYISMLILSYLTFKRSNYVKLKNSILIFFLLYVNCFSNYLGCYSSTNIEIHSDKNHLYIFINGWIELFLSILFEFTSTEYRLFSYRKRVSKQYGSPNLLYFF